MLKWEAQIDVILARLTLEQKAGQLHQVALPHAENETLVRKGLVGSAIFSTGAFAGHHNDGATSWEAAARLQRGALESTGIPLLFARDVIHGHHVVFPIPLGQAAAWSPELVEEAQRTAAAEAAAEGLHWTFSPVVDVGRDPRWGRVAEGFGEDPVLAGELAAAAVRGFQGGRFPLLSCLKHYAGYGLAEGGRDYARAAVGPHELREVYLPPFRRGVEAGAAAVMAAFNEIDGTPATACRRLLREVLKGEWGFNGVVVSDWDAIAELICHGVAADRREAARLAIEAGVDVDMVSGCYLEHLPALVRDGVVDEALVNDAVRRVLRLKFAAGLFDDPLREREGARPVPPPLNESLALARRFAEGSFVLLKNERDALPLLPPPPSGVVRKQTVLLAGPFAECREELFGTWTCDGRVEHVRSVAEALTDAVAGAAVRVVVHRTTDSLVEAALAADVVVALVGEHPGRSGEAHSVCDLGLPPGQEALLETLERAGKPLVTVVFTGRPLALDKVARLSDALLVAWHPGSSGGAALADVLTGRANPGGRLPASFPRFAGQVPVHYSRHPTGRPLPSTASHYLDAPDRAQFPFGYGLGFTTFAWEGFDVRPSGENRWEARVTVRNTGGRPGRALTRLHARDFVASRSRPVSELRRFHARELEPGEQAVVVFQLQASDFAFSRADGVWGHEPGEIALWIEDGTRVVPEGFPDGLAGRIVLR
ncbi:beta-glucosidase [Opitutaceae bacterium TAV4]|nr:beta-glucosidase [Opitutaceae bacterium TAV4]RRK01215.1 beta-glucosidase [Opitutaceae bacterium TAV3]